MVLLDSDGFLTQLTRMLEKSREKGVVYVTMKRCEFICHASRTARVQLGGQHCSGAAAISSERLPCTTLADAGLEAKREAPVDPADCRCLMRAVHGNAKVSTQIAAKDHRRFMKSYANIMKVCGCSVPRRAHGDALHSLLLEAAAGTSESRARGGSGVDANSHAYQCSCANNDAGEGHARTRTHR